MFEAELALVKFGADSSEFVKELNSLEKRAKKTQKTLTGIATTSGAAFGVLLGAIAKTGAEFITFEKSLTGVRKSANLTESETKLMGDALLGLTNDIPKTVDELLVIAQTAGQLGIKGAQDITRFTETFAKLETASDIAGETGVKSMARILKITGDGVAKVGNFASTLVGLGNNLAASESEIVHNSTEIAKALAVFKIGTANVAGLGGAMADMGIQAEIGASITGKAFIEIKKSIDEGGVRFLHLQKITGLTGEQLKTTFEKDATSVFTRFLDGLNKIDQSGGNVTNTLNGFGLSGDGVNKVLNPLIINSSKVKDAINLANKEFKAGTALEKEFALFADTAAAKLDLAKNQARKAAITFGATFSPVISDLAGLLSSIAEKLSSWDESTIRTIGKVALFVGAISGAITALGILAKSIMAIRIALLTLAAGSGPIGWVIAGLGALTGAVAGYYMTVEDETEKASKKIGDTEKKRAETMIDVEKKLQKTLTDATFQGRKEREEINNASADELKKIEERRAKRELATMKAELELKTLEAEGAGQDAIKLKRMELASLQEIQRISDETEKLSRQAQRTAIEELTLLKNKSVLDLEEKGLEKILEQQEDFDELQSIEIGDFAYDAEQLIETHFAAREQTQRNGQQEQHNIAHDSTVTGSYPHQQTELQSHLDAQSVKSTAYYQDELNKRRQFLLDYDALGQPGDSDTQSSSGFNGQNPNTVSKPGIAFTKLTIPKIGTVQKYPNPVQTQAAPVAPIIRTNTTGPQKVVVELDLKRNAAKFITAEIQKNKSLGIV